MSDCNENIMQVISFDVGIKNLAYFCLKFSESNDLLHEMPFPMKYKSFSVLKWDIINVSCKKPGGVINNTVHNLDKVLTSGTFLEQPQYILIKIITSKTKRNIAMTHCIF